MMINPTLLTVSSDHRPARAALKLALTALALSAALPVALAQTETQPYQQPQQQPQQQQQFQQQQPVQQQPQQFQQQPAQQQPQQFQQQPQPIQQQGFQQQGGQQQQQTTIQTTTTTRTTGEFEPNVQIGIRVAPIIAYNRVRDRTGNDLPGGGDITYRGAGGTLSFMGGVFVDYFFRQNYALNFNVLYTVKRASFRSNDLGTVRWNMQMIQLPVTLKLYTNEIAPDLRLYFQLGASPDIVIAQIQRDYTPGSRMAPNPDGAPFVPVDVSLWFGTGAEYALQGTTRLFAGISYNRGLINAIRNEGAFRERRDFVIPGMDRSQDRYQSRQDFISLDLGIKF